MRLLLLLITALLVAVPSVSSAQLASLIRVTDTFTKTHQFPISTLTTDGTNCEVPDMDLTIGGGPRVWSIKCPNTGGVIYGSMTLPDSWVANGTLAFRVTTVNTTGTSDTNDYTLTVSAQCRNHNVDVVDNTWGTPVVMTYSNSSSANEVSSATSDAVTPAGSANCVARDALFWKMVTDTSATTDDSGIYYLNVLVEYTARLTD
jgi:hypothetical protein